MMSCLRTHNSLFLLRACLRQSETEKAIDYQLVAYFLLQLNLVALFSYLIKEVAALDQLEQFRITISTVVLEAFHYFITV